MRKLAKVITTEGTIEQFAEPETPEQWQEVVNAARFLLDLESSRQYGLITGGPIVHAERAAELLERGRQLGFCPDPFDKLVERYLG